jgi:NADH:ubiquinone oxidoreductase subunit 6 (subunit J)
MAQSVDIVQWLFFGILTLLTLGGGLGVVITRNLFHSALWLLVSLFGIGAFFVMLAAPFLAAVQVLVYIGAIVILIIIAIMLTRRMMGVREAANNQWFVGLLASALTFLVLGGALLLASSGPSPLLPRTPLTEGFGLNSVAVLGTSLVDPGQYVLPFELASLLLTGAMIGAIVIAREDT